MANLYDIKVQNELNDAERYLRLEEEEKALACLKRALELLYDLAKQATTEAQLRKYTDVINQVRPKYDELKAKYSVQFNKVFFVFLAPFEKIVIFPKSGVNTVNTLSLSEELATPITIPFVFINPISIT